MEKHRALHNLRRRRGKKGSSVARRDTERPSQIEETGETKREKFERLRQEITQPHEITGDEPLAQIFRDDYGRVISERQWNTLQKMKAEAKEGGYELDEYSQ